MDGRKREELALVRAWLEGDGHAGAALAQRHFIPILRYFQARVGNAVAEDLAQRTFLACVEALPRFRQASSFRTFLFSIARNILLQHRDRKGVRYAWMTVDSKLQAPGPSASTGLRKRETHEGLRERVAELPSEFRECVELYYWDELSVQEIAMVLDVPAGTVKSRLHRGRREIRRGLDTTEAAEGPRSALGALA